MAGGDSDSQSPGPDSELQRRAQIDRLAVHPGVYRRQRADLQAWRAPRLPWRVGGSPHRGVRGSAGCVENDDPESAAVQRRTGTGGQWPIERVGVVRHEHEGEMLVLAPDIVNQAQGWHLRAWAEHLFGGLQQCAHLGITVGGTADRVAVDPERDVVEKQPAVHLRHVDQALDPVGERVERAEQIVRIQPQIASEVVAGTGRHAHERKPMRGGRRGHDRQRPVATGHPSASAPLATASRASASRSWPGVKTTVSIPRSRARSATAARAAVPPPDLGLTNNTGRCGGSKDRRPSGESSDTIHHILARRR